MPTPDSIPLPKLTALRLKRQRRDYAIAAAIEDGMTYRAVAEAFGLTAPSILNALRRINYRKSRA